MTIHDNHPCLRTVLIVALAIASGTALAADDDVAQLIKPDSSISAGVGAVSGKKEDRAFFGQYNGMRKNSGQIFLDIDYLKRDDSTGLWTNLSGRNLGNENRELGFSQQKQGDWRYSFEYGELVRNYSNTINTNISGIGTDNLTVNSVGNPAVLAGAAALRAAQGTGNNQDLKTTRKRLGFGVDKWLTQNLQLEVSFKNEDKTGARMFGMGANCRNLRYGCTANGGAMLVLPEPINSSTRQFELKLNYSDDKLSLNGGYYGTFYVNKFGSIRTTIANPASMWDPDGTQLGPNAATVTALTNLMQLPMALPPDNQAHQFSLAGTYAITPTTRTTFKYSFTRQTQKESFDGMGLVGGPRGALDAVIDTAVGQVGITARPMPKLSLVANLRYEQKSDKTPIAPYRLSLTTSEPIGQFNTNNPASHTKVKGKLEASYQLPAGYRATGGIDYDMRDLGRPTGTNDTSGQANAIRAKTEEIGYRAELRKSLSETLNGTVSLGHSERRGSMWMTATNGTAPTGAPDTGGFSLFPLFWMDTDRDRLKASFDWSATNKLTFQASLEGTAEHYYAPTMRGARDGKTTNLNLDAAYTITDNWKMNGWYSRGDTIMDINGANNAYSAGLRQLGHNLGLGVRGAPSSKLEVGGDLTFSYEVNRNGIGVIGTNTQPNALPAAAFRQLNINIFGKYALDKSSDIKVNLIHQRYYSNEWFWNNNGTPFFFTDGTTVSQKDQQNTTFLGATDIYKFQ